MRRSRLGVRWPRVYLTVLLLLAVLGIVIYVVKQTRETESTRAMSLPVVDQQPELKKAMSSPAFKRELLTTRVGQIQLQRIPAGGFRMGSPSYRDQPEVRISRQFYLGVQEVTQGQYHTVMGENPSYFKGSKDRPVETVSWLGAVKFCENYYNQMSNNQKLSNDPTGPPSGTARVLRGGSFADVPVMLYSAIHVQWPPTHRVAIFGLRVARN